jgi:tetratricopeptide (TPR) repeat protein
VVGKKNQSALLSKYFSIYKKNSRSRVFAPLAESYRKLGMLEDAYKVLKEGIRYHPNYALGYIVLAHCYYDEGKFELTYNTLRPFAQQNADNISLQKIFAQSCIHLGHLEEALDTFKYLLFMNPRDKYFADQVKRLEDDLLIGHKKLNLDQLIKAPDVPELERKLTFEDDWVQMDFTRPTRELSSTETPTTQQDEQWVMRKPIPDLHPLLKEEKIPERGLEDDYFADEFEDEALEEVNASSLSTDSPIVSHTLIDLYCAQHYYDKAIELLEKIIELNPRDFASQSKLKQVLQQKVIHTSSKSEFNEEDGHEELISIIENQVKLKPPAELKLKNAMDEFLILVQLKAGEHRVRAR